MLSVCVGIFFIAIIILYSILFKKDQVNQNPNPNIATGTGSYTPLGILVAASSLGLVFISTLGLISSSFIYLLIIYNLVFILLNSYLLFIKKENYIASSRMMGTLRFIGKSASIISATYIIMAIVMSLLELNHL